jgi:hypothetical protein
MFGVVGSLAMKPNILISWVFWVNTVGGICAVSGRIICETVAPLPGKSFTVEDLPAERVLFFSCRKAGAGVCLSLGRIARANVDAATASVWGSAPLGHC